MANLDIHRKDNPKLQQSTLSDGRISLYLEYYLGRNEWVDEETGRTKIKHIRKKETLNLYLIYPARTQDERQKNKDLLELAKQIRIERENLMKSTQHGKPLVINKKINFLDYYQSYIDTYTKKDIRMLEGALARFKGFLRVKYPIFQSNIRPDQLSQEMMAEFVTYLEGKSKGEGARGYYQRFKKVVKYAVDNNIIAKNPCSGVVCKVDDQILKKDVLSVEELKVLISTTYTGQNPIIRKAFIFSLYTGIRFCDLIELKYSNVDYSNHILKFDQVKTKGHSANSGVIIPLNGNLIGLIGEKSEKDDYIFQLPSHTMCLKALKRWTYKAGINKHITWHCARHSFAVNILNNGANIKTVSSLLGHSGLKHTEKYTRAVDKLKEDAINSLPQFNL